MNTFKVDFIIHGHFIAKINSENMEQLQQIIDQYSVPVDSELLNNLNIELYSVTDENGKTEYFK